MLTCPFLSVTVRSSDWLLRSCTGRLPGGRAAEREHAQWASEPSIDSFVTVHEQKEWSTVPTGACITLNPYHTPTLSFSSKPNALMPDLFQPTVQTWL